jgi:hypothetical protein
MIRLRVMYNIMFSLFYSLGVELILILERKKSEYIGLLTTLTQS